MQHILSIININFKNKYITHFMDAEISYLHSKDEIESLKINSIPKKIGRENHKTILPINYTQSSFF